MIRTLVELVEGAMYFAMSACIALGYTAGIELLIHGSPAWAAVPAAFGAVATVGAVRHVVNEYRAKAAAERRAHYTEHN